MPSSATTSPPATTPSPATARCIAGSDRQKDQSYFLWGIDRAVVARMLTPVGELSKARPGRYARAARTHHGGQAGVGRDLLRAGRRLRRRAGAAPARRRAGAGARSARHDRRRGDRRAPGICPVHHRPAHAGCRADTRSRATWSPSGRSSREVVVGTRRGAWRSPRASGRAQLAGRATGAGRGRARCRSAIAPERSQATIIGADAGSVDLALASPVRAITPGQSGVLYAREAACWAAASSAEQEGRCAR